MTTDGVHGGDGAVAMPEAFAPRELPNADYAVTWGGVVDVVVKGW